MSQPSGHGIRRLLLLTTHHGLLTKPMRPLTLQQIRTATGGKPLTTVPERAVAISAVCTNSRMMEKASLFVALRGERFDGHDFLEAAAAGGAVAAVVERVPDVKPAGVYLLQVADAHVAMGKL